MPIAPNQQHLQPSVTTEVVYKPVVGFPGYRVGDNGSLWSCWKRIGLIGRRGLRSVMNADWHRIPGSLDEDGYLLVTVGNSADNTRRRRSIHRLVLEAFVGPRPSGLQARHRDGNPTNNRLTNLSWDTVLVNNHDKTEHGTMMVGENHGNSGFTEKQILEVLRLHKLYVPYRMIASRTGVSLKTVGRVCRGHAWKYLHMSVAKIILE